MKRLEIWRYPLLTVLAVSSVTWPVQSAPHDDPQAAATPRAARLQEAGDDRAEAGDDRAYNERRAADAREREAALLLMLGDAAAHWRLR